MKHHARTTARRVARLAFVLALLGASLALAQRTSLAGGDPELWVVAQDTSQVKIVGLRGVETIPLAAGTSPHLIEFSPRGKYAYVAGLGSGQIVVIRAADRAVQTVSINAGGGTHQVKPSPDGSLLLVAQQLPTPALVKVSADERLGTWETLATLALPTTPDCTVFRPDGKRAFVSLASGIAVVDVEAMTIQSVLPTDGKVACGFAETRRGRFVYVTSNGSGGHLYTLDTVEGTLTNLGYTFDAYNLHVPALSHDEKTLYISDRGDRSNGARLQDAIYKVDLRCAEAACKTAESIALDPRPEANDKPDGVVVVGKMVFVALRATGQLAVLRPNRESVFYIDLVPPSSIAAPHMALRP